MVYIASCLPAVIYMRMRGNSGDSYHCFEAAFIASTPYETAY